ncbi:MAG: TraB/GumN family protein [Flavobacteriales bacterium]
MRNWCIAAALVPVLAFAQAEGDGLLWSISGNGLSRPNYVLGTVHSRDARAYEHATSLLPYLKSQDALAGELDFADGAMASGMMMKAMVLPPGKDLADLMSKHKYKEVKTAVEHEVGPMAFMALRLKPFYLMALLGETAMRSDSAEVLDQYLQSRARAMGKEVVGLERPEEQLATVEDLPLKQQADMLYDLVRNDLYRRDMERMLDAYAAGDLEGLTRIAGMGGLPKEFSDRLIDDRNATMALRMDSLMQNGRSWFFAIGAAHLPEPAGVLERLRRMGYRVEGVRLE